MTTTVKIHVNGRYRATVTQDGREPVIIDGNYEGSPNPSGEYTFSAYHTTTSFKITEEQVPEASAVEAAVEQPDPPPAKDNGQTV